MMAADSVDVWLIPVRVPPAAVAALVPVLDPAERERADAIPSQRRAGFVVAHAAARIILGQRLATPPDQLRWSLGPHGKPALAGGSPAVQFNLSHSGDLAAFAVTTRRAVGVDVQEVRQVDARRLADRFFLPAEARFVAAAPGPVAQAARFTHLWARKEACVKSVGGRLMQGMSLPVAADDGLVRDPALPGPLLVRDVLAPEGFQAAVALTGAEPFHITRRWWRPPR